MNSPAPQKTKPNATRGAILVALGEEGPMCSQELVVYLGMTPGAVHGSVHVMRKRGGLIHIVDWRRYLGNPGSGGRYAAVWAVGPGKDCCRPVKDVRKEKDARYREKNRAVIRARSRLAETGRAPNPYLQLIVRK